MSTNLSTNGSVPTTSNVSTHRTVSPNKTILVLLVVIVGLVGLIIKVEVENSAFRKAAAEEQFMRNQGRTLNEIAPQSTDGKSLAASAPKSMESTQLPTVYLEIRKLKVYQGSSYAHIDFLLSNTSNKFISYWKVDASIYGPGGQYLGNSFTNGQNLKPHQTITATLLYGDTQSAQIEVWKPSIGKVTVDSGNGETYDGTRYFDLKEIK